MADVSRPRSTQTHGRMDVVIRLERTEPPAGTVLPIELRTTVGSETSKVEDQVRGRLRRAIAVNGTEVVPSGSEVIGTVTEATRSGRVIPVYQA